MEKPIYADWKKPKIPAYGTFPHPFKKKPDYNAKTSEADTLSSIKAAIEAGARHLDTAFAYGNQELIGRAIISTGLERDHFHIASKLHIYNNNYSEARDKIHLAIDQIFNDGFNPKDKFLDAFFIHYPGVGDIKGAWKAIIEARDKGLIRYPSVSNFEISHLKKLKSIYGEYPVVNQIEFHPWIYNEQRNIIDFCLENGIYLEGYSPLAQGLKNLNVLDGIVKKHRANHAKILLKWCMQNQVLPIVGSRNIEHIKSNFKPANFDLSDEEMTTISNIGTSQTFRVSQQWNWNPHEASFGEKRFNIKKLVKKILKKFF